MNHFHRSMHTMYRVRQQDLPSVGSSHQFVGAENGDLHPSPRSIQENIDLMESFMARS